MIKKTTAAGRNVRGIGSSELKRKFQAAFPDSQIAEMVMTETLDGFQGGLQIGGRIVTNLPYADDIILLATSEAELQELADRLDRVSSKYSLMINADKTKVMSSDDIACRILIQNEQLEHNSGTLGP